MKVHRSPNSVRHSKEFADSELESVKIHSLLIDTTANVLSLSQESNLGTLIPLHVTDDNPIRYIRIDQNDENPEADIYAISFFERQVVERKDEDFQAQAPKYCLTYAVTKQDGVQVVIHEIIAPNKLEHKRYTDTDNKRYLELAAELATIMKNLY